MARQEQAVDPTTGPLQSFAYELRKVRIEAGNPTYRTLAKAAGYSATTLSEAARGLRKPSLDVVLAYVGACGGDVEAWRLRWSELDSEPTEGAENPSDPVHPVDPEDVLDPEPGAASPPRLLGTRRRQLTIVAGLAGLAAVVALVVALLPADKEPGPGGASGCPAMPSHRTFTAVTYGKGAAVRAGATTSNPVLSTIPSGCTVGFTGFCLGEKMRDATGGTPDIRWFILEDGTVTPSALIHGNPPTALEPVRCNHNRPAPDAIALVVSPESTKVGSLKVRATGRNLDIVGFAVRYATGGWRQVGLTEGSEFTAALRLDQSPGPSPRPEIVIVAAACLGGNGPTKVIDAKAVLTDQPTKPAQQATLSTQEYAAAAGVACQYPVAK